MHTSLTKGGAIWQALAESPLQNRSLLQCMLLGQISDAVVFGSAITLVVYHEDGSPEYLFSAPDTDAEFQSLLYRLPKTPPRAGYLADATLFPLFQRCFSGFYAIEFLQYTLEPADIPKVFLPSHYTVRSLNQEDAPFVRAHYGGGNGSLSYIESRIADGPSIAVFEKNSETIAGFILTHDEGAIGMLEVLPPHRGKGLASYLVANQLRNVYERNLLLYSNVYPHNDPSIALHKKLGFHLCERKVCWIKREGFFKNNE